MSSVAKDSYTSTALHMLKPNPLSPNLSKTRKKQKKTGKEIGGEEAMPMEEEVVEGQEGG